MMSVIDLQAIAKVTNSQFSGKNSQVKNISIDSRKVQLGDVFIAIKGNRNDGHCFVDVAIQRGAVAVMVEKEQAVNVPQLIVKNTRQALGDIAKLNREAFNGKVVAITGSSGKTTCKNMLKAILSTVGHVCATEGNFNNEIGLPLTVQRITDSHDFAVLEMGAAKLGDIASLTDVAQPLISAVTNIGAAHIAGFGCLENTASTKSAIYNALPHDGWAIVNLDDNFSHLFLERVKAQKKNDRLLTCSLHSSEANIFATDIQQNDSGLQFTININTRSEKNLIPIELHFLGLHNIYNALLAAAMAKSLGLHDDNIAVGLSAVFPERGRLSSIQAANNLTVIDDSYNANPASVKAAIDVLATLSKQLQKPSILVVGDMAELGDEAIEHHHHVGRYAAEQGINSLYAIGVYANDVLSAYGQYNSGQLKEFKSKPVLIECLLSSECAGGVVLIKGSRSAAMDQVVDLLSINKNDSSREKSAC
tara:strand:+ start:749 stop:2179 length:1431 start_codon:yes stop_codon:yes gene_type:complete